MNGPPLSELDGTHWPLLGTVVDVQITSNDRPEAERAERIVCDEIGRLENVFSVYDNNSLLRRWINDPTVTTTEEFDNLLALALAWQQRSRGAFNVSTRAFWTVWSNAAADGTKPRADELRALAAELRDPPFEASTNGLTQIRACSDLDLNAIAKGYIVDIATATAWERCDLVALVVNAGGDVKHLGPNPVDVGIEDPAKLFDNAPPLLTVPLHNASVASSGSARRGFSVAGEWISHIIDPRTGQPAYDCASVTAVAPDAATADVMATIVSVMSPAEGLDFVSSLDIPVACWIVDRSQHVWTATS